MRILLVEDSERVAAVVTAALRGAGHVVCCANRHGSARELLDEQSFDLAVFDIGLPDGSGLDLCRATRSAGLDLPILLLTARGDVDERVQGLDAGADDYLCKPFATSELLARVRALSRRGPHWAESLRAFGPIVIDRDRREVTLSGARVALTAREFEVVALLAWSAGRVLPRSEILDSVWGGSSEGDSASLEVLVSRIRRKLSSPQVPEVVRTVRHVGYAWSPDRSNPS